MKKREYNFASTVDVPVGSPAAAAAMAVAIQAKEAAPDEEQQPSLQEVRERRRKDKKTRRDKEKAVAAEQTPGADASPLVAAASEMRAEEEAKQQHKSRREKKEKRRHRKQRQEEPSDAPAPDATAMLLSVLEAKVATIDRELRAAGPDTIAKHLSQLTETKEQLTNTVFPPGEISFRATLLSDRIDILFSRHGPKPQCSAPIMVPIKSTSDRQSTAVPSPPGSQLATSPRSWSQARGDRDSTAPLVHFGSHRSGSGIGLPSPPKP